MQCIFSHVLYLINALPEPMMEVEHQLVRDSKPQISVVEVGRLVVPTT